MYALHHLSPDRSPEVRGLTLGEAFVRIMALTGREYRFTRTGWAMHLLMTHTGPGEPEFLSHATNDAVARQDIKRQVLSHGLGEFVVTRDLGGEKIAAE